MKEDEFCARAATRRDLPAHEYRVLATFRLTYRTLRLRRDGFPPRLEILVDCRLRKSAKEKRVRGLLGLPLRFA